MTKIEKTSLRRHPLQNVYRHMIERCYNPGRLQYQDYGGRGVTVSDEWRLNKWTFIHWGLNNGWSKGLQLDRIDNNGNYNPENCRFVTPKENSRNRRDNKIISYKGHTLPIVALCEELGIDYHRTCDRLYRGWSIEKAVETPKLINQYSVYSE